MEVLIVSKTLMSNAACIGALASNGRNIRLLNEGGFNQPIDTEFEVRQIWEIEFVEREDKIRPHIEDVIIRTKRLLGILSDELTMLNIIQNFNCNIWRGGPDGLFDGLLKWTDSGSGYISENVSIPNCSVGFWIPDRDLTKKIFYERVRFSYPKTRGWRSLPYVGFEDAIEIIPSGTLVRVSLARWWDTNGTTEHRCSLQISGWYDLLQTPPTFHLEEDDEDLPF